MGNFQGGGNRGGGGYRGGGGGGGGRPSYGGNRGGGDRGPVTMHKAVCDECQKSCEVPFRPSGDKPIYCNDCFASKREDSPRPPRKDFGDRGPRREFDSKPDNRPSFGSRPAQAPVSDDIKRQLGEMNMKLDRLVGLLEKNNLTKQEVKSTPTLKEVIKKAVVVKSPAKKEVKKVIGKKKK
jgi:CxxC-x17-CxxC domain-containing protein